MTTLKAIGAAMLAAALLGTATAPAAGAAPARACGDIAFTDRSEDGVFDIRARGVRCGVARRVARAAEPFGVGDDPYRYRAAGFACRGVLHDRTLPHVRWRCVRGARTVTFHRA